MNGRGKGRLIRGAIAGGIAWGVMDQTLQLMYNRQSAASRRRENQARRGVPALEVLAARLGAALNRPLSRAERQRGGTVLQWAVGIGAGMGYSVLREQLPGHRAWRGIGYGAAFSLLVDEGLVPLLGLAPRGSAFPWQTHARGFAGHLVFGLVAEVALELSAWIGKEKHARSTLARVDP